MKEFSGLSVNFIQSRQWIELYSNYNERANLK